MIRTVLIFLLCFITILCSAQTQGEINQGTKIIYQNSEKELNATYQKIIKEYSADIIFIKNLRIAQRLWIQFRDAEMKMKFPDRAAGYYGSAQPLCWFNYKTSLTNERIKTLQIWLKGIEEGDVCSGSVKRKQ